jgi:hypothetical protein
MTLSRTSVRIAVAAVQSSVKDLTTAQAVFSEDDITSLGDGTGANQADLIWSDTRTLAASATENLDLAGSLVDALGSTLTFARVKAIYVHAADGNVNDVVFGGAASNGFVGPFADATDKIKVKSGGTWAIVAPGATGYPVTAGTGDILLVANGGSGTSVTYDIVIIGASA